MTAHQKQNPPFGVLPGAVRDKQSITKDWVPNTAEVAGVRLKEVKNVPK